MTMRVACKTHSQRLTVVLRGQRDTLPTVKGALWRRSGEAP